MLSQPLLRGNNYDPETDAPPAGQLTVSSQRDLFLATFVVPVIVCLAVHWAVAWIRHSSTKASLTKPPGKQKPPRHTPDNSTHRHRHSRPRQATAAHPKWDQQPTYQQQQQAHYSPPPLQTYHQLQQQQYWDGTSAGYMMDPPQQQYTSPQTDRPFRRSQARAPPPSPQSERPFRVTQSQRVYSTPGSEDRHTGPSSAAAGKTQSQTPQTDRPFRVNKVHVMSPQNTNRPQSSSQAGRVSASPQTTDAPFKFRDTDERQREQHLANGTPTYDAAANGVPMLFTSPSQQQQQQQQQPQARPSPYQQQRSPGWQQQRVQMQQQRKSPVYGIPQDSAAVDSDSHSEDDDTIQETSQDEEEELGALSPKHTPSKAAVWDPALLRRCAQQQHLISSVEGLQQSQAYRKHIKQARQRHMTLELKEKHKLNVYKALRNVDPESFRQLFSRQDVLEYDELPLSRPLALFECLLACALTFALLGVPLWLPAWQPYKTAFAVLWLLQQLWVVVVYGCSSVFARMLSIYSTQGLYSMRPSSWRLLAAVAVDTLLVVGLPVLGLLASLTCRLLTEQRQSCGERLLRLQPMREVVRPMHFSPYSPAGKGMTGGIETDDAEDE